MKTGRLTPVQNQNSTYKQSNSKFYGFLYKASSLDDVKLYLKDLKEKFPDASLICYDLETYSGEVSRLQVFTQKQRAEFAEQEFDLIWCDLGY